MYYTIIMELRKNKQSKGKFYSCVHKCDFKWHEVHIAASFNPPFFKHSLSVFLSLSLALKRKHVYIPLINYSIQLQPLMHSWVLWSFLLIASPWCVRFYFFGYFKQKPWKYEVSGVTPLCQVDWDNSEGLLFMLPGCCQSYPIKPHPHRGHFFNQY